MTDEIDGMQSTIQQRLTDAIKSIRSDYEDDCIITGRDTKFGQNSSIAILDGYHTVQLQGSNETFVTDNLITHISSSDNGDVIDVTLMGHTVSAGI